MDLIERQKAIDELISEPPEMNYGFYYAEKIKALPSAESEIVRCKECKHHRYDRDIPYCDRIDYGYGWEDDEYCNRAERKTDEND